MKQAVSSRQQRFGTPHPLAGSHMGNLIRVLRRHGRDIELRYWPRLLATVLWVAASFPIRWWERLAYGRRVARQPMPTPVFIVGHWRSGTTFLHNLMLQGSQFRPISLLHCLVPCGFLSMRGPLTWLLRRFVPKSRPMDKVTTSLDAPMSEDFALVGLSDLTHYLAYFFPQKAVESLRRAVLFEGVTQREIDRWTRSYGDMLRKITFDNGGGRLLLKNPPNTGRMPHILRAFPDACFIHVARNPYVVHASTVRLFQKFHERFALQQWTPADVESAVSQRYELLMRQYFRDRDSIPASRLIEVRHEELVDDPINTVKRVYEKFHLGSFASVRSALEEYVAAHADYRQNTYEYHADYIERIRPYVEFTAERWGYEPPTPSPAHADGSTVQTQVPTLSGAV